MTSRADVKSQYTKSQKLGEGTYAVVYQGIQKSTGRTVAIKKIKVGQFKEGLDMSAIREVKFLRELQHENVIELIDVYASKSNLNLVLEFLDSDLETLIRDKNILFTAADIKSWMVMIMRGLHHCHRNFILHRDMKPNNLLISSDGILKIADFGLSRDYAEPYRNMTSQVVTRWYRAPELLFGAKMYGSGVDIWAVSCIFAELLLRNPFLPGDTDMTQLDTIFRALGTPTEEQWPGMKSLADYCDVGNYPAPQWEALFSAAGPDALHLLRRMFAYNPAKRPTCAQVLEAEYFSNKPRPTRPCNLPRKSNTVKVANDIKRNPEEDLLLADKKVSRKLVF